LPTSAQAPKELVADANSDDHPMNRGLLNAQVGTLSVFMFTDDPGRYWLDMFGKYPASDSQARAAFGADQLALHREQAADLAVQRRIDRAVDDAVAARDAEPESLKDKAQRIAKVEQTKWLRENARRIQAEADRQRTGWLDQDLPVVS
jgi:hypothetical protein